MECLICYNIIFDDFTQDQRNAPQIICKLLQLPILTDSLSSIQFCTECHRKLYKVGQLYSELDKMRGEIEFELVKSQKNSEDNFNENENRTVIVREIKKRWAEKGDHHKILNTIKEEKLKEIDDFNSAIEFNHHHHHLVTELDQLDKSIQNSIEIDDNDNVQAETEDSNEIEPLPEDQLDLTLIKDEMRVILEPFQYTLTQEAEESTFNINEASIVQYIARDQDRIKKINLQRNEIIKKYSLHDQESKLCCPICNKYFKREFDFNRHKTVHTERSFHCDKCGKIFFVKRNLRNHIAVVHQTHPFHCEICSKSLKSMKSLKLHLKTHGIGNTIQCTVCSRFMTSESSRKQHMANVHGDGPVNSHLCNICGKVYAHRSAYLCHYQAVHIGIKLNCDKCDLTFKSRKKLEYHKQRVHDRRNFVCQEHNCSKRFFRNYDLKKHISEVHLKERKYICSEVDCGEKFVSKTRLTEHTMSKHTHEKQYFCRFCEKGFVIKGHLKRHEKENCSKNR